MSARCGECRFFDGAGADRGQCRRNPPQRDNDMTRWPSVFTHSDWCGEFQQRITFVVAKERRRSWLFK